LRFDVFQQFNFIEIERNIIMPAVVDQDTCTGCEACVGECPSEAISMEDGVAVVDEAACVDCAVCVDACPVEAISME
jgi:ferredoxin